MALVGFMCLPHIGIATDVSFKGLCLCPDWAIYSCWSEREGKSGKEGPLFLRTMWAEKD